MSQLKESLRESMRFVDLVRDGEIHPRVAESERAEPSSQGVFHEVQSESARVIDWEHEHGKDGLLGALFADAYSVSEGESGGGDDDAKKKSVATREHFDLKGGERQGTGVLSREELLSRAAKSKGGYFYVKRSRD